MPSLELKDACGLLLAVLLLTLCAGAASAASEGPVRPLRVVTYNVLHGGPASGFKDDGSHLEVRLEMAIRELTALEPDIVAIQEASQSRRYGNVPERIARRLGFHLVFAPATDRLFGFSPLDKLIVGLMGFKEGSAILSRFPIIGSDIYDLPRCQRFLDPRILLRADLSTPWGPLQIFSTHTARSDECQMERVGEIVRESRGTGLSILMGDFNTPETSKVLTTLRNEAGFVDAFRSANPDDPGPTVWQRIEVEKPTVSRRVDFIFLLSGRESTGSVRSSRVVLDRPGRLSDGVALWPSDHYGVFAEVEIVPIDRPHTAAR
ncbi:MAG: endonuclease/exonuclease/phosphatase family protein [Nitrospiraceae bacterium]